MSHEIRTEEGRAWDANPIWQARCSCGYESRVCGASWAADELGRRHVRRKAQQGHETAAAGQ